MADQKFPPSEGETNAEHKAKMEAGREKGGKKSSEFSDGSLKDHKPKGGAGTSVSSEGLEPKSSQAISSPEAKPDGPEGNKPQDFKPLGNFDQVSHLAQNTELKSATGSGNKPKKTKGKLFDLSEKETNREENLPKKALQDLEIMSQRYEISPLVEVLDKCRPPNRDPPAPSDELIRLIGGAQLYRILSQNIHGFEQEEDAYTVKRSQWNSIEFPILRALKPRPDDNRRVDWQKERARFVSRVSVCPI